jgi:hypothetical protein
MQDFVSNLMLQARLLRFAHTGANVTRIAGFEYRVEGTSVIRYNPDRSASVVESPIEITESLNLSQKALLRQNRRAALQVV